MSTLILLLSLCFLEDLFDNYVFVYEFFALYIFYLFEFIYYKVLKKARSKCELRNLPTIGAMIRKVKTKKGQQKKSPHGIVNCNSKRNTSSRQWKVAR